MEKIIYKRTISSLKEWKKNIKYSDSIELFNVEDVPQIKDEDTWFVESDMTNICLSKNNDSKTMKKYIKNT